jgi:hypothetical protein
VLLGEIMPLRDILHSVPILIGFSLLASAAQLPRQFSATQTGSVSGIVLDGNGKPLPRANVYAIPETDMRKQFPTVTNDAGEFTLRDLPEGTIHLSAFKESDGYPYNFFSFFNSPGENVPIELHIKAGQTIKDVRIKLGERAARLNVNVTTADGKPLNGVSFLFTRPDQPDRPYTRGLAPTESILVPPVPFHVSVEAKGYKTWQYGTNRSGLISLKPGETLDLAIRLEAVP